MHAAEGDVKFVPYEKMGDSTASWQSKKLDLIKKWVATEKVHGANFSFTVFEDGTGTVVVKVAKRSGFLTQTDNFFGVYQQPRLIDDECDKARCLYRAIGKKSSIRSITIYGELFGGCYSHPSVPKSVGVTAVQKEVVYCPDLMFMAFDVSVTNASTSSRSFLDYDTCIDLFQSCGFRYAEPLVIGTLQDMLNFPLGFESTLPAKLGLPQLPNNTAEGIVIKPVHTAVLESKGAMKRVIFKRKVDGFAERKPRCEDFRAKHKQGCQQNYQLLKYEMLALVTEQRVVNTISKLGQPSVGGGGPSWDEIRSALISDVMEELKTDEALWGTFISMSKHYKGVIMTEIKEDCKQMTEYYRASH